jgi:hypothetical protein
MEDQQRKLVRARVFLIRAGWCPADRLAIEIERLLVLAGEVLGTVGPARAQFDPP